MKFQVFSLKGYNTYVSPYQLQDGEMIQCTNMDNFPVGGKTKRPGYGTIMDTSSGSQVTTLIDWHRNDGTTFNIYKYSGSVLEYSIQGTGAWTPCGNGTLTAGANIGYTVMNDVMIIGDGTAATRHSTDGTSFTNTTLAPVAQYFTTFQSRVYAGGTANTLFWSTIGDATNWSSAGTSDSSSIDISDPGRINSITKVIDRVIINKNSGVIFRWDGYNLTDMTTSLGPTSDRSTGEIEDFKFYLNRLGFFGFGGNKPQLVSNNIRRLIYNDAGNGIAGTTFDSAPGVTFKYNYLCAIGTVTDDLTGNTINNAISKYDYQLNQWGFYQFANNPTAWLSYKDNTQTQQLIFGDAGGQVYQVGNGNTADNGSPIEANMTFVVNAQAPESIKEWKCIELAFNPGNQAKVQVAYSDVFLNNNLKWQDLGDCSTGVVYFRLAGRSRLLFIRVYEASRSAHFTFYGFAYDAEVLQK